MNDIISQSKTGLFNEAKVPHNDFRMWRDIRIWLPRSAHEEATTGIPSFVGKVAVCEDLKSRKSLRPEYPLGKIFQSRDTADRFEVGFTYSEFTPCFGRLKEKWLSDW